jgi:hypothetical protein
MLIPNLDAMRASDWVKTMSRPREGAIRFTSFQIHRNGVLDHVMNGPEPLVRIRMRVLNNQYPEDSWDCAPTQHWHDVI